MEYKPKKIQEEYAVNKVCVYKCQGKNTETFHSKCVAFVYFIIQMLHCKHSHCFVT